MVLDHADRRSTGGRAPASGAADTAPRAATTVDGLDHDERYRIFTEMVADLTYVMVPDEKRGMILEYASEGLEKVTGYSPEEFVAIGGWKAIVPPDHLPRFADIIVRLLGGEPTLSEGPIIAKSGEVRFLRSWSLPILDPETGGVVRIYGAGQDVTDAKRAELALEESERALARSERRLRSAQILARMGSWRIEDGADVVEWSDELYRMARMPRSFVPTVDAVMDHVHPSDRDPLKRAVIDAVTKGETTEIEYRFLTGDGHYRWLLARIERVTDGEGRPVAAQGTSIDITERKEQEERYRAVSEMISDVAYSFRVVDGRAEPEWITDSFCRLTGYLDEEPLAIMLKGQALVHPDDWPTVVASTRNAVAGNEDVCEYRLVTASGSVRNIRAYCRPVIDDVTGEVVRIFGAAQDVTESRRVEEALRRAYHRERAAAAELRTADRLKDEFLTTASHELRTPLTSIVGFASALSRHRDELDPETRDEVVEKLERNALEMGRMVERLLDFSRLQSGAVKLEPRPVVLDEAVLHCVETHASALEHHHITTDLPTGLRGMADPEGLHHVLGNLITNAAKYSPAGTTITVGASDERACVVMWVSDEGMGVPAEVQARLFDRFYRGPDQPAGQRGSGIGLAIVQTYITLMGGDVRVESEVGRGSTFRFTLPACASTGRAGAGSTPAPGIRAPAR